MRVQGQATSPVRTRLPKQQQGETSATEAGSEPCSNRGHHPVTDTAEPVELVLLGCEATARDSLPGDQGSPHGLCARARQIGPTVNIMAR